MKRIGVDAGGTFTDSVLWDEERGLVASAKVSSDRADPSRAVIASVKKLGEAGAADIRYLIHGTTVATNATLERSGPRVGLICTEGFRDVLEIARLARTAEELYDLRAPPTEPLVRRRDRLEISERIDHRGEIVTSLDEASVVAAARVLARRGIKSVAVCLLHAYLNEAHEHRVKAILEREMPGASISISSDVLREFREYERTTTTVLNAYLAPGVGGYLGRLQQAVGEWSQATRLWIMQSNGGVASAERSAQQPVTLLLSGPSGGIVAGRYLMEQAGLDNSITIDMGGTSFDVCLLPERRIPMTNERRVMDVPVKVPSVDILTIGAGGGSIGWVDGAGQFRVGPQSAGAFPGPACYGRGGEEPTVTDANLVLGVLGAAQRLGGEVSLDPALAQRACERLGRKLRLTAQEVAWGIRRIVNTAMAGATSTVSVGRGFDPRDFSLIAFGGAGPMHAVDIAAELQIPTVLVPAVPGCLSALGLVVSDVTHDYVVTYLAPVVPGLEGVLNRHFAALSADANTALADERIAASHRELFRSIDLRYIGQQFSVSVPFTGSGNGWLRSASKAFHAEHEKRYGYSVADEPIEVVNLRLRAVGRLHRGGVGRGRTRSKKVGRPAPSASRRVAFGPGKRDGVDVPVFARTALLPGMGFNGPAVVEQSDSTLIVPPRCRVRVDGHSNLLVTVPK